MLNRESNRHTANGQSTVRRPVAVREKAEHPHTRTAPHGPAGTARATQTPPCRTHPTAHRTTHCVPQCRQHTRALARTLRTAVPWQRRLPVRPAPASPPLLPRALVSGTLYRHRRSAHAGHKQAASSGELLLFLAVISRLISLGIFILKSKPRFKFGESSSGRYKQ